MSRIINPTKILLNSGVGILATDTLYGLVARALDKSAVERLYVIKQRNPDKPFIILIASINDIQLFNINLDDILERRLHDYWPGRVSIILPCKNQEWAYLHRGTNTLAFRIPAKSSLVRLLRSTGPLVAPSANPEGMLPAHTLKQARKYFGDQIDFYRRGITLDQPSSIIQIDGSNIRILR